jgi:hypothetical protein
MRMLAWPVPVIRTATTLPDAGTGEVEGSLRETDLCS